MSGDYFEIPEEISVRLGMYNKRYVHMNSVVDLRNFCDSKISILSNPDIISQDMPNLEELKLTKKRGRPTHDPGKQYTLFLPDSIAKYIEPLGDESRSKRIFRLIEMGIAEEKESLNK